MVLMIGRSFDPMKLFILAKLFEPVDSESEERPGSKGGRFQVSGDEAADGNLPNSEVKAKTLKTGNCRSKTVSCQDAKVSHAKYAENANVTVLLIRVGLVQIRFVWLILCLADSPGRSGIDDVTISLSEESCWKQPYWLPAVPASLDAILSAWH